MPAQEAITKDGPAFMLYAERWTHGTRGMTKVQRCDFMDLLCHQWTSDGLPEDLNVVARLIGYRSAAQIPPMVIEKFPLAPDGRRRNPRLEEERERSRKRHAANRDRASKAGSARWKSRERTDTNEPLPNKAHPSRALTPTLEQVKEWAVRVMAPEECAQCFFSDHEARPLHPSGKWTDRDGNAVANPLQAFTSYATRWKKNNATATKGHAPHITGHQKGGLNRGDRYS